MVNNYENWWMSAPHWMTCSTSAVIEFPDYERQMVVVAHSPAIPLIMSEWACEYCGVPNHPAQERCIACGAPRGTLYEVEM
jgi:rubrerythrin